MGHHNVRTMPSSAATGGSELVWPPPPYSSASAIVGGTVTGHHILQIDGYSYTKEKLPHGKLKYSRMFNVGDHQWHLRYYPNGQGSANADYISVYLGLDAAAAGHAKEQPMKARATFSLLDRAGKPTKANQEDELVIAQHLLVAADRYGMERLKLLCEEKVVEYIDRGSVATLMALAEQHHCHGLKEACFRFLESKETLNAVMATDGFLHLMQSCPSLLLCEEKVVEYIDRGSVATLMALAEQHHCQALKEACFRFLESKETLNAVMATDGFLHLMQSCPSLAEVFRALLAFIYTDALPETKTKAKQEDELVIAQHLLVVADRYGMERLKLLCEEKVVEFIDRGSVATLMALAEQHHCHGLKGACFRFLESKETLNAVMATDGFLHLMRSCPSLVKDLVFRVADSHFQ
uniref:MATH domain-containing protein n=1 Tax=Oryza barthii TaxID=65489 RepID=A0A0D3HDU5_9ORYZ